MTPGAGQLARLIVRIHRAEAAVIADQKTLEAVRDSLEVVDGGALPASLEDALVEFTATLSAAGETLSRRVLEALATIPAGPSVSKTQPVNALGRPAK